MVFDSKGRLIVADRANHRIQILDTNGKSLGEYREGIALDGAGNLYTAEATVRGVTKYVKK